MSFIRSFAFKAELTRPAVMDFIGRTPAEVYFLVITGDGSHVYGIVTEETTIEYLINEFTVKSLEFVPAGEVKKAMSSYGCRSAGNINLLEL
jgi:hypothetical protein